MDSQTFGQITEIQTAFRQMVRWTERLLNVQQKDRLSSRCLNGQKDCWTCMGRETDCAADRWRVCQAGTDIEIHIAGREWQADTEMDV